MKERRDYILRNENAFVGLEDSKKTWSLCVRSKPLVAGRGRTKKVTKHKSWSIITKSLVGR